jgi:hypothetical protein
MAFDDLIRKIREIEEEVRKAQQEAEERKQGLQELGMTPILAGELHRDIMYNVLRWRKEKPSALREMTKKTLQDLKDKEFITQSDFKMLNLLIEPRADHKIAQEVYQKMLGSKETSQLALTLSSIALHSHLDALSDSEGDVKRAKGIGTADVAGGIGGAGVGANLGGPWGAVIGGVAGGVALSLAAYIEEEDDDGGDDDDGGGW